MKYLLWKDAFKTISYEIFCEYFDCSHPFSDSSSQLKGWLDIAPHKRLFGSV
eukprot:m.54446 g.54446  ORF g.54446 m.54446 type:complete len:52 (-) comp11085_c0_seq6:6277-6432(-)